MASHAPGPTLADYAGIVRDLDGIELFADLDEPMLRLLARQISRHLRMTSGRLVEHLET